MYLANDHHHHENLSSLAAAELTSLLILQIDDVSGQPKY